MTPEEINITIQQHFGWKKTRDPGGWFVWTDADGKFLGRYYAPEFPKCPDYCRDLNAIHGAEITLWKEPETVEAYETCLQDVYLRAVGYGGCAYWFMAGAYPRAEAFLRTIGKWVD